MARVTENPDVSQVKQTAAKLIDNIGKVIVGKSESIKLVLVALLCEGHLFIEDVPGIGKTMLAKATASSLDCSFKRIQFTPDLLPSDVTGIYYFNQKTSEFEFRPGPIMANIVLADEINRATPRTQSCLLECMQERQVTVDVTTMPLPRPFMVIATQNPVELEGTFPLPEAQLDRFLLKVRLGYPSEDEEEAILQRFQQENPLDKLTPVVEASELLELQKLCRQVYVEESVRHYIVAIAQATRNHQGIKLGASPRASLSLYLASQSLAALQGRNYVIPDDVKYLVIPVLSHRLVAKVESKLRGQSAESILEEIAFTTPVPVERAT
ncbi:MAG TPA: MoxR family ATPase [Dehalococcoidales bacterium]|nr:MoxR family ATPase [Dehalococcoidales bacterium]